MIRKILILFTLAIINTSVFAISQESLKLTARGDTAFMRQEYIQALDFYIQAAALDDSNYFANYNIARTLCTLRDNGGQPCDMFQAGGKQLDLQQATIFEYIRNAVIYSPMVIRTMEKDTALKCLYTSLEYHFHMGKMLNKPLDLQNMLPVINWRMDFEDQSEWIVPDGKITFTKDLRFVIDIPSLNIMGTGSYSISPYQIKMKFDKPLLDKVQIWAVIQTDRILISGVFDYDLIIWNTTQECQ